MITLQTLRCHRKTILKLGYQINYSIEERRHSSMYSWKVNESISQDFSGDISSRLSYKETRIPTISSPWDVLVKVYSTSVNPLDVRMISGYGKRVLDTLDATSNLEPRITNDRYPLTLGRDFSGEVIASGHYARHFKKGDKVYGAVEPQRSGAHAQFVVVPSYCVAKKPNNLTHNQASSIPFIALTTYSALCTFGNLKPNHCSGKQILVIGGSGGIGTFAIQILKLWGANVSATCSEEKIEWLENSLFVDRAICHHDTAQLESLYGRFDFVLDCGSYESIAKTREEVVTESLQYLKPFSQGVYVTLSPPILSNIDNHGMLLGTASTIAEAAIDTFRSLRKLNSARWAFFLPNKNALNYITRMYETNSITPQIHSVFSFNDLPKAFEELESGKVRGKVVVDVLTELSIKKQTVE